MVSVIQSGLTRDKCMAKLLRELAFLCATGEFELVPKIHQKSGQQATGPLVQGSSAQKIYELFSTGDATGSCENRSTGLYV